MKVIEFAQENKITANDVAQYKVLLKKIDDAQDKNKALEEIRRKDPELVGRLAGLSAAAAVAGTAASSAAPAVKRAVEILVKLF